LEKALFVDRDVIARHLFELHKKGVFQCNREGYITSPKLMRYAAEVENNRKRQRNISRQTNGRITVPTLSLNTYTPPLRPPEGAAYTWALDFEKPKRGRPATNGKLETKGGAETGNGSL